MDLNTHTIRYDADTDTIVFHPKDTLIAREPVSLYLTAIRDVEQQTLLGFELTQFRMMRLTLEKNGALRIGLPMPLEDALAVALRMSGTDCSKQIFDSIRVIARDASLPVEIVNELLEYPIGWN